MQLISKLLSTINAFRNLKFSAKGDFVFNPSAIDVWISVDDKIVKVDGGKIIRL